MIKIVDSYFFPGYIMQRRQPTLMIDIQLTSDFNSTMLLEFLDIAEEVLNRPKLSAQKNINHSLSDPLQELKSVAKVSAWLMEYVRFAMFDQPVIIDTDAEDRYRLALACIHCAELAVYKTINGLIALVVEMHKTTGDRHVFISERLIQLSKLLNPHATRGINTLSLLKTANDLDVPWKRIYENVYQFGWARNARVLDSTITDKTPALSSRMAGDKVFANKVLLDAGIPVVEQKSVNSLQSCINTAKDIGFPIVVKASNLEGGQGVFTGLDTLEDVEKAYVKASKLTKKVVVEKHFEGADYRLQVLDNEVYWIVKRTPASVVGDGKLSVIALINQENEERHRLKKLGQGFYSEILIDEELEAWLRRQGLTLNAVPSKDYVVRLKGAANASMGGTLTPIDLEQAHPDNIALAIRAAKQLQLDLAGVDLLIQDIEVSWLQTGAVICEVNAQPQLSPHLPAFLIPRLVKQNGRVAILVIIGQHSLFESNKSFINKISKIKKNIAYNANKMVFFNETQIATQCDSYQAGVYMSNHREADVIVLTLDDDSIFSRGLAFDRVDYCIVAGKVSSNNDEVTKKIGHLMSEISGETYILKGTQNLTDWFDYPAISEKDFFNNLFDLATR